MLEAILTFIVFVGVLIFVVQPVVNKSRDYQRIAEDTELRNLEQEKFNIYAQIKEADFEYEMGKLSHRDYSMQRDELLQRVSEVIDQIERHLNGSATAGSDQSRESTSVTCPSCQTTLPRDAKFCAVCGEEVQAGCSECGSVNPEGSKFCAGCGQELVTA